MKDAKGKLEGILKKYKNSSESDELELLKCKVLLDLSKLEEADEKADKLIKKKSNLS